jgi:microcystin-dependent protein
MSITFRAGRSALTLLSTALALTVGPAQTAKAQETPLIGQLMLFGGNFCPRYWAEANGALLPISQYTALFSIFGTTYGGDGRTTFALPDLRGRTPMHRGTGPGLTPYAIGQKTGREQVTLTVNEMPSHNHMVNAVAQIGNHSGPGTDFLAITYIKPEDSAAPRYATYHNGPPDTQMDPAMIANTGGNESTDIRNPRLTMMWCVALTGIFPSRN